MFFLYIFKIISYLFVWEYMKKMNNEIFIRENYGRDRCVGFNRISNVRIFLL